MHWRRQGDLGELWAMEWFASKGALVCVPVGHSPAFDFVAVMDDRLLRVQVKTCTFVRKEQWSVSVFTRGVRGRARAAVAEPRGRRDRLYNRSPLTLGGMSEWLKERRCKRRGTAYAGSNPAPPTPAG